MNILEIKGLTFSFKNCNVLKNITCDFEKGKVYSLIGHNGAGKTTFIRLCLNILPSKQGTIRYFNSPVISYVPDRGGLYEWLTVEQNIEIFLELNNKDNNFKKEFIDSHLKKWRLSNKREVLIRNLSMGQKQRLSILLAEVNDPDIIFLDEPTNSIDITSQEMLNKHLNELRQLGKTIIISSHDINLIEQVSDKIMILDDREIVFEGNTSEIKNLAELYKKYTGDNENEND